MPGSASLHRTNDTTPSKKKDQFGSPTSLPTISTADHGSDDNYTIGSPYSNADHSTKSRKNKSHDDRHSIKSSKPKKKNKNNPDDDLDESVHGIHKNCSCSISGTGYYMSLERHITTDHGANSYRMFLNISNKIECRTLEQHIAKEHGKSAVDAYKAAKNEKWGSKDNFDINGPPRCLLEHHILHEHGKLDALILHRKNVEADRPHTEKCQDSNDFGMLNPTFKKEKSKNGILLDQPTISTSHTSSGHHHHHHHKSKRHNLDPTEQVYGSRRHESKNESHFSVRLSDRTENSHRSQNSHRSHQSEIQKPNIYGKDQKRNSEESEPEEKKEKVKKKRLRKKTDEDRAKEKAKKEKEEREATEKEGKSIPVPVPIEERKSEFIPVPTPGDERESALSKNSHSSSKVTRKSGEEVNKITGSMMSRPEEIANSPPNDYLLEPDISTSPKTSVLAGSTTITESRSSSKHKKKKEEKENYGNRPELIIKGSVNIRQHKIQVEKGYLAIFEGDVIINPTTKCGTTGGAHDDELNYMGGNNFETIREKIKEKPVQPGVRIEEGDAVHIQTSGFIKVKDIILTVPPSYGEKMYLYDNKDETLQQSYRTSMDIVVSKNFSTVGIPVLAGSHHGHRTLSAIIEIGWTTVAEYLLSLPRKAPSITVSFITHGHRELDLLQDFVDRQLPVKPFSCWELFGKPVPKKVKFKEPEKQQIDHHHSHK